MELQQKLRVNPEHPLWLLNAPDGIEALLPGITVKEKLGKAKPVAQLVIFATDSAMLNEYLPMVAEYVAHDTVFWICYPKKTGAIASDLVLMNAWNTVFSSGYRVQTSISINADWSGLRLTNAPRRKPSVAEVPMEERKVEGVDYVNRTTTLPEDAKKMLSEYKGLDEFFYTMSFSHQREYIEAIVDAKKPETRTRRIEKMAEALLKMQEEKELKKQAKAKH